MRSLFSLLLIATLMTGLSGCGGVSETDKKAAEKVPDLDIGESTTADKSEEEGKKPADAEPAKP